MKMKQKYLFSPDNAMPQKANPETGFLKELERRFSLTKSVKSVADRLTEAGFEPYLVGGCLRDLLLGKKPKDWDITTNARPEEILEIFPESVYENQFGTVGVKTESEDPAMKIVEVTTFRREGKYSDKRHPDTIEFADTVEEDLSRRDFTINAIALKIKDPRSRTSSLRGRQKAKIEITAQNAQTFEIIDPFGGREDLKQKLIRAVGDPRERFSEDALRMLRAIRFAAELGFDIEEGTLNAIAEHRGLIEVIAKERIRDELIKLIIGVDPTRGLEILRTTGLLKFIMPELEEGWNVTQNKHHIYTVWEHNLRSLQYAADKNYSFEVRLAALLHDIGKPRAKRGEGPDSTFYGHEVIGARMTAAILERLRFSRDLIEKITRLVRYHLFYYDTEQVTDASVRRLVNQVGPENIMDLVRVREADRIGSGVPKAVPYKLRHFMFRVEKVLKEPVSLKQLAVTGEDVMKTLGIGPGPKIGMILQALFEEVLDEPKKNRKDYLEKRMKEFGALSEAELQKKSLEAKEKYRSLLEAEEEEMKKKYYVA